MPARPLTVLSGDDEVVAACRRAAELAGDAVGEVRVVADASALSRAGDAQGLVVVDPRALAPLDVHEWALDFLRREPCLLFLLTNAPSLADADGLARFVGAQAALPLPPEPEALAERLASPFGVPTFRPEVGETRPLDPAALGESIWEAVQGVREPGERERFLRSITDEDSGLPSPEYWRHRLEEEFKRSNRFRYPLGLASLTLQCEVDQPTLLDLAGLLLLETRDVDLVSLLGWSFVALLPHTGPEGTRHFAERVLARIQERGFQDLLGEPLEFEVKTAAAPDPALQGPTDFLARVCDPGETVER